MGLLDSAAGVISGILNKGTVSAPDLTTLFTTINNSGQYQKDLINMLPVNLQKQYQDYQSSNAATGTTLQNTTNQLGQNLMAQTEANYDPNAPAVKAAEDAAKTSIYADVPGQQAAIREALAATGGFDRGTASKQLAAPVLQAGQQYGQQVANISASQLQQKQQATQNAINTVNSMDVNTMNSLFGMSKEQALQILQGNRQDLKDQLTQLVQQSQNQTNQTLGVQGADITNQYNQKVAQKAQSDALNNSFVNLGVNAVGDASGFLSGLNTTNGSYNSAAPQYEGMLP
jgi:hypothetical protein